MPMTITELALRLNVTEGYVRNLIREGEIPSRPGPDGEPFVEEGAAERYIAEANDRRRKAMDEYLLVSAEQHAVEQLNLHFTEFMHVARRMDLEAIVRARCAYEALYEVAKFAVNLDGIRISAESQPDAFTRAVVDRAARVLRLTPEEAHQAQALNEWSLTGLPADPPISADVAVRLAERMLAASLGSRGR